MSLYLARADRVVIARSHTRIVRLGVEAADASNSIRYSSSKLTCTTPACERVLSIVSTRQGSHRPSTAFARMVRLARPGGSFSGIQRIRTHSPPGPALCRSAVWIPIHPCDPVLRTEESEPAREAWQYQHPRSTVTPWPSPRLVCRNGVEYLRAYPRPMLCEDSEELFTPAEDNWYR